MSRFVSLHLSERVQVLLLLLFLGSLGLRVFLAFSTPEWIGEGTTIQTFNDEPSHFKYIQYLAQYRSFPWNKHLFDPHDPDIVEKNWIFQEYEYAQPPLYYLINVPFVFLPNPLLVSRLFSVFLSSITLLLAVSSIFKIFKNKSPACATALVLIGFHPIFLRIGASVNNDNLAWLISALLFRLYIDERLLERKLLCGILLGAGLLTKTSLLIWPVFLLLQAVSGRSLQLLKSFAAIAILTASIGGWWLVRNHMIYGDWTGIRGFAPHPGDFLLSGSLFAVQRFLDNMVRYSYFPIAEEPAKSLGLIQAVLLFFLCSFFLQFKEITGHFEKPKIHRDFVLFSCINFILLIFTAMRWEILSDPRYTLTGLVPLTAIATACLLNNMGWIGIPAIGAVGSLYWISLW